MKILAIETSCDETGIAVIDASGTRGRARFNVLSNIVASQVKIHRKFGGVVPNLAKREHQKNLVPVLIAALKETRMYTVSGIKYQVSRERIQNTEYRILDTIFSHEPELLLEFRRKLLKIQPPRIDAIAVTVGPGLAPALWTGVNFARALALVWQKPIIPVNHLAGHIYVNALRGQPLRFPALALIVSGGHTELVLMRKHNDYRIIGETQDDAAGEAFDKAAKLLGLGYPGGPAISALALIVSGGHTELVLMRKHNDYRVIGETQDDAAGEAFDKVAKLLGLGYPGGPAISALAEKFSIFNFQFSIKLPRPMINSKDFNFSFSGLKTAVLYLLRDQPELLESRKSKAAVAAEFQNAIVETLVAKTLRAAKESGAKTVILGGGVAANTILRKELTECLAAELAETKLLLPEIAETTDNALMIAAAAFFSQKKSAWRHLRADPGLRLSG